MKSSLIFAGRYPCSLTPGTEYGCFPFFFAGPLFTFLMTLSISSGVISSKSLSLSTVIYPKFLFCTQKVLPYLSSFHSFFFGPLAPGVVCALFSVCTLLVWLARERDDPVPFVV